MTLSQQAAPKPSVARIDLLIAAIAMTMLAALAPLGRAQTPRLSTRPSTHESHYSRAPEQEITFQQGLLHYSRAQLPQAEQEFASVVKSDPADAEAQVVQAITSWASEYRVAIQVMNTDRQALAKDASLGEIAFTVGGTGNMSGIAHMLWRMQYATIPLRITDVKVVSTKDATDSLSATVRLSTVYLPGGKRPTTQPGAASHPGGGAL